MSDHSRTKGLKHAFLFSAMRHFAEELQELGYKLLYTKLDDADNGGSFKGEVGRAVDEHNPKKNYYLVSR